MLKILISLCHLKGNVFLSLGLVLATYGCVICQGKRTDSTLSGRYEKLVKCQTLDGAQTLQKYAYERGDNKYLLAQIGHLSAKGIVAKELWYHSSCRRDYTRPIKEKSTDRIKHDSAFVQLIAFIEKNVINEGNIIKFSTLQDKYKQFQEEHDCPHIQGLISKNLKRRLANEFKEKLQYKAAKKGVCFVYCPDSSHFCEGDYSKEWTEFSQNQKLKDVSDIL